MYDLIEFVLIKFELFSLVLSEKVRVNYGPIKFLTDFQQANKRLETYFSKSRSSLSDAVRCTFLLSANSKMQNVQNKKKCSILQNMKHLELISI